jgi:glycosyltransferase involved in cell wall biosynthesis
MPRVSIIIKALNEERHIGASLRSALAAAARVDGEVILADSGSTDRTVEIARSLPVTVLQLCNPEERRCGVGPQLGYQVARGDYVYVLDGDMELDPAFLPAALAALAADSRLAGVAGVVEEESDASYQFRGRKRRARERKAQDCEWLDMGGLYRVAALREVGYLSNRNLHAYEEMELGLRLVAAGWGLQRLPLRSVLHHGRPEGNWGLLVRRWRSRYLDGAGELLRAAHGKPFFARVVRSQAHLLVATLIWIGLVVGIAAWPVSPAPMLICIATLLGLIAVRAARTRNMADAVFGQVVWQVTALAMVRGYFAPQKNPRAGIDFLVLANARPRIADTLDVPPASM